MAMQLQDNHFGIGFDFTPSYATAAVSFANGSNIPLARIDGDLHWRTLMADISWNSDQDSIIHSGASRAPVMAEMLQPLAKASEPRLGHEIEAASLGMPRTNIGARWGTPISDLVEEAFSLAGLEYLRTMGFSYLGEPLVYPENAVMAGHGLGLCQPYTSTTDCLRSESDLQLPQESYYFVGYYGNALEVATTTQTVSAYGITIYPYLSYELGADAKYRNPDEHYYWEQVRKLLSMPLIQLTWRKPSKVIFYGNSIDDPGLRATVKEVLSAFLEDDELPDWIEDDIDPVYAGSFGAAEFAKRKPYWDKRSNSFKMDL